MVNRPNIFDEMSCRPSRPRLRLPDHGFIDLEPIQESELNTLLKSVLAIHERTLGRGNQEYWHAFFICTLETELQQSPSDSPALVVRMHSETGQVYFTLASATQRMLVRKQET